MKVDLLRERMRLSINDWLLTLLTILLVSIVFVFAPLQATGHFVLHAGAITILLAVMASMAIISKSKIALGMMLLGLIANVIVLLQRYYYAWPYDLHLLAASWLLIAIALGAVVTRAVFGPGYITYHRVVGAVLVYLLIAVGFACRPPMHSKASSSWMTDRLRARFSI